MKLIAGLALAGTAFAGFPDPKELKAVKYEQLYSNPDNLLSKEAKQDFNQSHGKGTQQMGDCMMDDAEYCRITGDTEHEACKELADNGPGVRSFKKPRKVWDQYKNKKNGRYRIALKVDWESYRYLKPREAELIAMRKNLPLAMQDMQDKTGIEFGWHCDQADGNHVGDQDWCHDHWISLTARSNQGLMSCSSWLGRMGNFRDRSVGYGNGEQQVSIAKGCTYKVTIAHEIIHALGWVHEQARSDRDQFVEMLWQNINQRMWSQFKLAKGTDDSGTPYDPASIMHYHDSAFANRRGVKVMKSKTSTPIVTSREQFDRNGQYQENGMSEWDAFEINYQYPNNEMCADRGLASKFWNNAVGKPIKGANLHDPSCLWPDCTVDACGCTAGNMTAACKGGDTDRFRGVDVLQEVVQVDKCDKNPCENGGKCVSDKTSSLNPYPMECQCADGFEGAYCESEIGCEGQQEMMFNQKMEMTRLCDPFSGFKQTRKNKIIDLSGRNNIRGILKKAFSESKFSNANNLKLHRSNIAKLDKDTFYDLPYLKKINLKMNKLKTLPAGLFESNSRLETLVLSENQLSGNMPKGILTKSLKNLYLNDNPKLILSWGDLSRLNLNELHIWNTKLWNSQYTHEVICGHLTRSKKAKKCCYATEPDAFGAMREVCKTA